MKYLWFLLLFHTLFIPVAISLSEGSGFLLAVIAAGCLIRCRPKADIVPKSLLLPIALFVAYAVVLSISGLQPEGSYEKLYRFLSFGVVFAIPFLVCRQEDPKRALAVVVGTYLLGVVVLGLTDAIRIPVELKQGVSLFDTGNMRDPQFYMTAILLLSGVATFFPAPGSVGSGWFYLFMLPDWCFNSSGVPGWLRLPAER